MLRFMLSILLLFSACSSINRHNFVILDPRQADYQQRSDILHKFLVAQLHVKNEDYERSFENFLYVSEESEQSIPAVEQYLIELHLIEGRIDEAVKSAQSLLESDDSVSSYIRLAKLYLIQEDYDQVIKTYQAAEKKHPGQSEIVVSRLISKVYLKRKFKELRKDLKYLEQEEDPKIQLLIARVYEAYQKVSLADQAYSKAEQSFELLKDYLRFLIAHNRFKKANQFLEHHKDHPTLGQLFSALQDRELAKLPVKKLFTKLTKEKLLQQYYLKGVKNKISNKAKTAAEIDLLILSGLFPKDHDLSYLLASTYAGLNKYKFAISKLEQLSDSEEVGLKANLLRAVLLAKEKRFSASRKVFQSLVKEHPKESSVWQGYISTAKKYPKEYNVEQILLLASESNPKKRHYRYNYASYIYEQGQEQKAVLILKDLVEEYSNYHEGLNFLAYHYVTREANNPALLKEALAMVSKALKLDPENPYYLDTRGWIYYKLGEYELALADMEKSVKDLANDAVILEHYADVLYALKKNEAAFRYWKKAINVIDLDTADHETKNVYQRLIRKLKINE